MNLLTTLKTTDLRHMTSLSWWWKAGVKKLNSTKTCQTLWVEEACHPKGGGSSLKHPIVELFVSL